MFADEPSPIQISVQWLQLPMLVQLPNGKEVIHAIHILHFALLNLIACHGKKK